MKSILCKFDKNIYKAYLLGLIISIILTVLVSYKSMPTQGILSYIDHAYFFNHSTNTHDISTALTPNYFGHSQTNSIFLYLPRLFLIHVFSLIGFNDALISYILFFGIFFLCSYIFFILIYKLSNNVYYSILAQIIIVINNLSIEHIVFGSGFFYYLGLIGFILILYNIYTILINNKIETKNLIFIILSSILLVHPFYFVMFTIIWTIFSIYILLKNKNIYTLLKNISISFIVLLIHSYWVFMFINGLIFNTPQDVYGNNNVDAVMEGFNKVSSYLNVVNGYQYFNFAAQNINSSNLNYIFYPLIIFIIFISYIYFKNKVNRSFLNLGMILFFIFLHLSLGPNSRILGGAWSWMWENVSAFQFFRSFSRFQIVLLPIIIFIFIDFDKVWKYKYKNLVYLGVVSIILSLNIKMFTGNLDGNIVSIKVPEDYNQINEILKKDNKNSNIIALPYSLYESYSWANNKDYGVMLKDYYLKDYLFIKPIIYDRAAMDLSLKNQIFKSIFQSNDFSELNKLNVGYILIQKDMIDVLNNSAPIPWEDIKEKLDKDKNNFEKLIENEYYVFYKYLPYSAPVISNSNSKFTQLNPWHYEVKINEKNLKENMELILLKNYDENWEIYLEEEDNKYNCYGKQENINFKDSYVWSKQCEVENKPNSIKSFIQELRLLFIDTEDFKHSKYESYANKWSISKQDFDRYKDGDELTVTIYYKPQIYLYLGVIVTIITTLATATYLLLLIYKKKLE